MSTPEIIHIAENGTFVFDANLWKVPLLKEGAAPHAFPLTATVLLNGQEIHYHSTYHEQWFHLLDITDAHGEPVRQWASTFKAWRN